MHAAADVQDLGGRLGGRGFSRDISSADLNAALTAEVLELSLLIHVS
jgi:hypothetical protein